MVMTGRDRDSAGAAAGSSSARSNALGRHSGPIPLFEAALISHSVAGRHGRRRQHQRQCHMPGGVLTAMEDQFTQPSGAAAKDISTPALKRDCSRRIHWPRGGVSSSPHRPETSWVMRSTSSAAHVVNRVVREPTRAGTHTRQSASGRASGTAACPAEGRRQLRGSPPMCLPAHRRR